MCGLGVPFGVIARASVPDRSRPAEGDSNLTADASVGVFGQTLQQVDRRATASAPAAARRTQMTGSAVSPFERLEVHRLGTVCHSWATASRTVGAPLRATGKAVPRGPDGDVTGEPDEQRRLSGLQKHRRHRIPEGPEVFLRQWATAARRRVVVSRRARIKRGKDRSETREEIHRGATDSGWGRPAPGCRVNSSLGVSNSPTAVSAAVRTLGCDPPVGPERAPRPCSP